MSKNNSNNNSKAGGIGFFGLLAIAFIVLKLFGVIKWSWVWVLAPIWLPTLVVIAVAVIFILWVNR